MLGGAAAAGRVLGRRAAWDRDNRRVQVMVDEEDILAVATRAGLDVPTLLPRLHDAGATHVGLTEDTLGRWLAQGRVWPVSLGQKAEGEAPLGRWTHLAADDPALVERLVVELNARLPQVQAH